MLLNCLPAAELLGYHEAVDDEVEDADDKEDLRDLDDNGHEARSVGPEEDAGIEPVLCDDAAPDELGGDLGDGQVFRLRVVDGELDDEGARPVVDPVHLLQILL